MPSTSTPCDTTSGEAGLDGELHDRSRPIAICFVEFVLFFLFHRCESSPMLCTSSLRSSSLATFLEARKNTLVGWTVVFRGTDIHDEDEHNVSRCFD